MIKFDIPEKYYIRWQAALAVLEDLQEDTKAPFDMRWYGKVKNWYKHDCGSVACFAGWITVAPYCQSLGAPTEGDNVVRWLSPGEWGGGPLWGMIFSGALNMRSRANTLAYLERTLKSIFKASTGKTLKAPLTFYVD